MNIITRMLPLLVAAALQQGPIEPGWTELFNGKDFTGWKVSGNQDTFKIVDGALVANGPPAHAFYDGPFMNHAFRNFELKVDVMAKNNSNGGVYVLTEFQDKGFPRKGFEIQVNNTYARDPVKTGSLYHVMDVTEALPKDDEWFTEHIIVQGNTITVNVNGKETVKWTQPADWAGGREGAGRAMAGPGTIALQGHDPNSTVYYKNIRIKPLGNQQAPAPAPAPATPGDAAARRHRRQPSRRPRSFLIGGSRFGCSRPRRRAWHCGEETFPRRRARTHSSRRDPTVCGK